MRKAERMERTIGMGLNVCRRSSEHHLSARHSLDRQSAILRPLKEKCLTDYLVFFLCEELAILRDNCLLYPPRPLLTYGASPSGRKIAASTPPERSGHLSNLGSPRKCIRTEFVPFNAILPRHSMASSSTGTPFNSHAIQPAVHVRLHQGIFGAEFERRFVRVDRVQPHPYLGKDIWVPDCGGYLHRSAKHTTKRHGCSSRPMATSADRDCDQARHEQQNRRRLRHSGPTRLRSLLIPAIHKGDHHIAAVEHAVAIPVAFGPNRTCPVSYLPAAKTWTKSPELNSTSRLASPK